MTHDYTRHGTTTLFAALDVKSGMVIPLGTSRAAMPCRAREFQRFLRRIDRAVLKLRYVHLDLDSEAEQKTIRGTVLPLKATHKTPEVKTWLEKRPRFLLHFTPTSASWLNLVERVFAGITSKRIRSGSGARVDDLATAICDYPGPRNTKSKPFTFTKTPESICTRDLRALNKFNEIRGNR